jgi:2-phosphoglycerate kinase
MYKPLIIFLGGSDGVGKSRVGIELAKKLNITAHIGTDIIREIMRACVPKEFCEWLHNSAILVSDYAPTNCENRHIFGFEKQAALIRPAIEAAVHRATVERRDMILDGVHLIPGMFELDWYKIRFHHFVIVVNDPEQHRNQILGQGVRRSGYKLENLTRGREFQRYLMERAEKYRCKVINNVVLDEAVAEIMDIVENEETSG